METLKIKSHKITLDNLTKLKACKHGIKFFKNNNEKILDLASIDTITGEYRGYIDWLIYESLLIIDSPNHKYDKNNNLIYKKDLHTHEWHHTYNAIHEYVDLSYK